MKRIKLFEAYNKEETLLGLAKMGLRTNRKEVFDLAIKRGLDIELNFDSLKQYCIEIVNYNSLEWIYSDEQEYQEYIDGIITVDCENRKLTNFKGIERLTRLRRLYIRNNNLTSLEGIEKLPLLTELYCSDNNLTNLKGIEKLTNLSEFHCYNNKITSLKEIEHLDFLYSIHCYNNEITSLEEIIELPNLDELEFDYNPLPQELLDISYTLDEDGDLDNDKSYYEIIEEIKDYYL